MEEEWAWGWALVRWWVEGLGSVREAAKAARLAKGKEPVKATKSEQR